MTGAACPGTNTMSPGWSVPVVARLFAVASTCTETPTSAANADSVPATRTTATDPGPGGTMSCCPGVTAPSEPRPLAAMMPETEAPKCAAMDFGRVPLGSHVQVQTAVAQPYDSLGGGMARGRQSGREPLGPSSRGIHPRPVGGPRYDVVDVGSRDEHHRQGEEGDGKVGSVATGPHRRVPRPGGPRRHDPYARTRGVAPVC